MLPAHRGANQLVLWAIAGKHNYQNGLWGTYQQWQAFGAQVRKGEKAAPIVYWGVRESENDTDEDEGKTKSSPVGIAFSTSSKLTALPLNPFRNSLKASD